MSLIGITGSIDMHAVLIIGYNTNTNNYIYMDPETGRTHEALENAFDSDNNLVITANK